MTFYENYLSKLKTNFIPKPLTVFDEGAASETAPVVNFLAGSQAVMKQGQAYTLMPLDCLCLIITLEGEAILTIENAHHALNPRQMALFDCQFSHSVKCSGKKWDYLILFLNGVGMSYFLSTYLSYTNNSIVTEASAEMVSSLSMVMENSDEYKANSLKQLFCFTHLLLAMPQKANREESRIPKYLVKIKELFDTEYEKEYTLDMLEAKFHVNKYKIAKDFTKYYKSSPIHYLNNKRIEKAKQLLIESNLRINEIAFMVGFETPNHFINLFKKQVSITPSAYRKTLKPQK